LDLEKGRQRQMATNCTAVFGRSHMELQAGGARNRLAAFFPTNLQLTGFSQRLTWPPPRGADTQCGGRGTAR